MTDKYHTKVTVIVDANNGRLDDYPVTSNYRFSFDATDMTVWGYVAQFRVVLRAAGFGEKCINDALGER